MRFIHDVTVWTQSGYDIYGQPGWATPKVIRGRWERKTELFTTEAGDTVGSKSVVYLESEVSEGDYIYKGVSADASPPSGAEEVRALRVIDNVFGDRTEIRVMT